MKIPLPRLKSFAAKGLQSKSCQFNNLEETVAEYQMTVIWKLHGTSV